MAMRARYAAEGASCGMLVRTLLSRLLALLCDIRLRLLWVLLWASKAAGVNSGPRPLDLQHA